MTCLRLTLLRPRPGALSEAQQLLEELDETLSAAEGLVFSLVTELEAGRLGRFAVWRTREDANREATRDRVLSLRSRLRYLSLDTQETLMDVRSGRLPSGLAGVWPGVSGRAPRPAVA